MVFKKSFELALISFALIASATGLAIADERIYDRAVYESRLNDLQGGEQILVQRELLEGTIVLDFVRDRVAIRLQPALNCQAGETCAQVMPSPILIEAKIVATRRIECGAIETIAVRNESTRDGLKTQITVTDNSRNFCKYFLPIPTTRAILTTQGLPGAETRLIVDGDALIKN